MEGENRNSNASFMFHVKLNETSILYGTFDTAQIKSNFETSKLQSALEGQVSRAEVKWMGDGTWEPESVCFDWTNEDFKVKSLAQGGGRLELIVPLKLKGRSEGCSQSQDTRSAVIG